MSWYDLPSFLPFLSLSSFVPCPSPPSPTSDPIRPCPLALCLLCTNSEAYSCNYTMSTVGPDSYPVPLRFSKVYPQLVDSPNLIRDWYNLSHVMFPWSPSTIVDR